MKLRRATPPTDSAADAADEVDGPPGLVDDPPGLLDNPFRIRADEDQDEDQAEHADPGAPPPVPAEPVDRDEVEVTDQTPTPGSDQAETQASIDLRAEAPVAVPASAAHVAPPPRSAPGSTPPTADSGEEVMETPITEADRRDALDLTTVRPQVEVRSTRAGRAEPARGFLSAEPPRLGAESALVRLIATVGVIAIGTAVGAALVANQVEGWIVGLSVSLVCVILAAILWRSRRL